MPPQPQEIEGTFLHEFYRSGDFFVGEVELVGSNSNGNGAGDSSASEILGGDGEIAVGSGRFAGIRFTPSFRKSPANVIKVKGESPPDTAPRPGLVYRFYGRFEKHPKHDESFAIRTFTPAIPHDEKSVVKYLQQINGVGEAAARAAWEKFGSDAVKILREHPEKAAAALGKRYARIAEQAAEKLTAMAPVEGMTLDLMGLLDGSRFPRQTLARAISRWGNRAAERIRRDPHCLRGLSGCGFKKRDALYLRLGLPPARLKRQGLCMHHAVTSDSNGSTWFPIEQAVKGLHENISGATVQPVKAMRFAVRAKLLSMRRVHVGGTDKYFVADNQKAKAEGYVAKRIAQMMLSRDGAPWPDVGRLTRASDHQKAALESAFKLGGDVAILRGYPGTGKSFVAGELAKVFLAEYGESEVAFAAPTGRAAVRFTEAMGESGVQIRATTTHSMLGVKAAPDENDHEGGWSFEYNAWSPLPYKIVMLDETSMKGCGMMMSLLSAMPPGSKLVLIGDTGQLPPVEYGAPLRDFIAAGVPTATLSEIWRNSGTIVQACHAIAKNAPTIPVDMPGEINPFAKPPRNLGLVGAPNNEVAADKIVERLCKIRDMGLCDPVWDTQVLVAVNKHSPLSRVELNKRLQAELNPRGETIDGTPFRVGDKVIQLKNKMLKREERERGQSEEVYAANGDMGRVLKGTKGSIVVSFIGTDERIARVPIRKSAGSNGDDENGGGDGSGNDGSDKGGRDSGNDNGGSENSGPQIDLGYAATVWKSQGSQMPVALFALDEKAYNTSRQFAYTAISRAKMLCLMFGKRSTLDRMRRKDAIASRKTFLRESTERNLKNAQ